MILSLDTEATGLDLYHGARPYFVTTCDDTGEQSRWEWEINEDTRSVMLQPFPDLQQIQDAIDLADELVLQNCKFDYGMLRELYRDYGRELAWDWSKVQDTLLAGHLLASNKPHDLTSMALQYLGIDIKPYEDRLEKATQEARRYCRSHLPHWRIASKDLPEMPSAKEKTWKLDSWLPKALARHLKYPLTHPWYTVLHEYASTDSAVTLAIWVKQKAEIKKRGLWTIYQERLKLLPVVCKMEERGVTVNKDRLEELRQEYQEESKRAGRICTNIAKGLNYDLDLPKSGNNGSLRKFFFGTREAGGKDAILPVPIIKQSIKTGEPSLDKNVLEEYESILPAHSKALSFVRALRGKRKRDTALLYLDGYERFWLPLGGYLNEEDREEAEMAEAAATATYQSAGLGSRGGDGQASKSCDKAADKYNVARRRQSPRNIQLDQEGNEAGQGAGVEDQALTGWFVLHPSLNVTGTDTLRMSSNNPNEQNISKQEGFNLRRCFGPAPGREWWSLDYQNLELRIPSFYAGEEAAIEVFLHPEKPPHYGSYHLVVFDALYPELFARWDKEECKNSTYYQWVKNGNFALIYGAQEETADRTYHVRGAYHKVRSRFPKISALNDRTIAFAQRNGYVETIPDKTVDPKHGYPLLCSRSEYGRVLPTVPLNFLVQGTAMWIASKAVVYCQEKLNKWRAQDDFDGYIIIQLHDEMVFDFPRNGDRNLWRIREIQKLMEQSGDDLGIPTPVSIEYHARSWAEGKAV